MAAALPATRITQEMLKKHKDLRKYAIKINFASHELTSSINGFVAVLFASETSVIFGLKEIFQERICLLNSNNDSICMSDDRGDLEIPAMPTKSQRFD